MKDELKEQWFDAIITANKHSLVMFCFLYDSELYYSEWRKATWTEPKKIDFISSNGSICDKIKLKDV